MKTTTLNKFEEVQDSPPDGVLLCPANTFQSATIKVWHSEKAFWRSFYTATTQRAFCLWSFRHVTSAIKTRTRGKKWFRTGPYKARHISWKRHFPSSKPAFRFQTQAAFTGTLRAAQCAACHFASCVKNDSHRSCRRLHHLFRRDSNRDSPDVRQPHQHLDYRSSNSWLLPTDSQALFRLNRRIMSQQMPVYLMPNTHSCPAEGVSHAQVGCYQGVSQQGGRWCL